MLSKSPSEPIWPSASVQDEPHREAAPDAEWNAGNMGCGELVMGLRLRFKAMQPGQILKLTATDDGAPEDIPAWCRLTGHKLVSFHQPEYWIQRKEN